MRKEYALLILSLLVSLFIYLFYRTEKTVINELFITLISYDRFVVLKEAVIKSIPLNEYLIYSLPEGLWVFCITLTSKSFYIKVGNRELKLLFLPLIFSIGLELFQLLHLTNGRFDFWDIGFSVLFWAIANYLITSKSQIRNILNPFTAQSGVCILSYLIVFLAHVWK